MHSRADRFALARIIAVSLLPLAFSSCSLYSHVSIAPLYLKPGDVTPPAANVAELVRIGDYPRAIEWSSRLDDRDTDPRELAAAGRAHVAAGHFSRGRELLRRAYEYEKQREELSLIAWELSQAEFLQNQYHAALHWAEIATEYGLSVRPWYTDYLAAMSSIDAYRQEGADAVVLPMRSTRPEVPRFDAGINGNTRTEAILDSGAVLSIISRSLAERAEIQKLVGVEGTFYGLLGEPISVEFGVIDSLQLGSMTIRNVPVAIMQDDKLSFFVGEAGRLQMDLLLGANLLKHFRLELDFWRESLGLRYIHPSMQRPASDANLFFVNFRPMVHTTIAGRGWYLFVLDTGSEISYLNQVELRKTKIRNAPRTHNAKLQGLGGAQKQGSKIEKVTLGVDQWAGTFRDIPLYASDHGDAMGIVGEDFLRNFRVVIDFGTMRLDLEREPGLDPYTTMRQRTMSADRR